MRRRRRRRVCAKKKSVASCVAAMSRKGSIGSGSIASTSTISLSTNLNASNTKLQPCGASSQLVLQAQGSSILCFQHDSLVLERRFEGHSEDVVVLSVDNQSDSKLPRVVSIDASRTAIVWDLDNGEEISRYSSYEEIRAVSWMKNGNLTFGNALPPSCLTRQTCILTGGTQATQWEMLYFSTR